VWSDIDGKGVRRENAFALYRLQLESKVKEYSNGKVKVRVFIFDKCGLSVKNEDPETLQQHP